MDSINDHKTSHKNWNSRKIAKFRVFWSISNFKLIFKHEKSFLRRTTLGDERKKILWSLRQLQCRYSKNWIPPNKPPNKPPNFPENRFFGFFQKFGGLFGGLSWKYFFQNNVIFFIFPYKGFVKKQSEMILVAILCPWSSMIQFAGSWSIISSALSCLEEWSISACLRQWFNVPEVCKIIRNMLDTHNIP